jgi:voltage-gated potassium channel
MTMTTVGYGDVIPKTAAGKIIGAEAALLGIAVFAVPTSILAAGFLEEFQGARVPRTNICPNCGESLVEEHPQTAS